jgi:hypothetical protein
MRIPAWCDRVLFKGKNVSLLEYNRAEQLMSDHRPVYAVFSVEIMEMNKEKKALIENELRSINSANGGLLNKYAFLPPPSADDNKWWENFEPSTIPPSPGTNPFVTAKNPFETVNSKTINLMD